MNRTQAARSGGPTAAAIRPARPQDQAALTDFFAGLSMQTRYLRFFAPITPTAVLLRLLIGGSPADRTGVATTDAIVAVVGGRIIGHAMAADRAAAQDPQDPQDPQGAQGARMTDIGVVVADAWQGRGVGSALIRELLSRAQARGVTVLAMDVLLGNHRVLAMIASHWPAARIGRSHDFDTIHIRLPQRQPQPPLAQPAARAVISAA
jgi:GNAT superfamily N-acetyltransferase